VAESATEYSNSAIIKIAHQSWIPLRKEPSSASEMVSCLLFGEKAEVLSQQDDWLEVRCLHDQYMGFIPVSYFETALSCIHETEGTVVDLVGDADSYMVYGAHVVRPDNFDVRVTGSGTVHCVDCSVNLPNTIAASGTALHLRQNISAVVTDGTGLPRSGVKIDVVGRSGAVLASAITDAEGFAMLDTVLIGITTNKLVDHRPVTVRMTAADGSTQEQSVITSLWAQVQFRDSTIVSVHDRQSALPTVRPMPLTTSHAAYVVDERGITSVDIVSITGSIVRHVQGSGTDRVALATQDLAPGAYTVVVTTPTGRSSVPIIVR
jgi:hypothetical protein